ncbi:MAG: hypothetical protein D6706_12370, partial [Chloroflexi bacterium]
MQNRRWQPVLRVLFVGLVLFGVSWWQYGRFSISRVQVAVAKGKAMMDMAAFAAPPLNVPQIQQIALNNLTLANKRLTNNTLFVNAQPLTPGEARPWQDAGCGEQPCALTVFYDTANGGTVNAIVNLATEQVVASWSDPLARPAGSSYLLDKAFAIAANDPRVRSVLGDIGTADPAMIPMSGWLMDDACSRQWCVDLTFHDPAGSGRIFHVFVNMQTEQVARTFYTRGRPNLAVTLPNPQRNAYTNGCHEQYGWEVCWEMTAHDGVLFRDARFKGKLIFSSAKIGQIEAWYPSWPGGYRDEIGFAASVPPFGDTLINDLGEGFEVRQLFTEFTHWPNCICCYRYEEIIRFFADGSLEFRFVSHGPGCDDLSIYRPFWRINLDLGGAETDSVWLWEGTTWEEVTTETEIHPFVDMRSPEGDRLATFDGDLNYRWFMERTDPLGLDEAYVFLLHNRETEGEGPIVTGPGDTYQPPRQWLDSEPVSGEDITLWFVPLLKTKKGGPWWCMPDPEPGINQCEAVLRGEPGEELRQPTAEELAEMEGTATAVSSPTPIATPMPTPTPRPIEGNTPEEIILNSGCGACHQIGALGEAGKVGPDLSNIGTIASERIPGMSAADYLR